MLALTGGTLLSGCSAPLDFGSPERLPVLIGPAVANDTDRDHDYRVRVACGETLDATPERRFDRSGTVRARGRAAVDGDWPNRAGRYRVAVSVDGGTWRTQDLTERLVQEEQVCYAQTASITDSDAVSFWTNLDAPCPDR